MKKNYQVRILIAFSLMLLISSCSKDDEVEIDKPQLNMNPAERELQLTIGDTLHLQAGTENSTPFEQEWLLEDSLVSSTANYTFNAETTGEHLLIFNAYNASGVFNYVYQINVAPKPVEVLMTIEEQEINLVVGDSLQFGTVNQNEAVYTEIWSVGDSLVSEEDHFTFEPQNSGNYILTYEASNATSTFIFEYQINVAAKIRPITETSIAYVSELLEFNPAPGQFINKSPGNLESAQSVVGGRGLVSLGAWGGNISFAFDHTILNQEGENDIIVNGNALPTGAEPGVIYVMQDDNANGLPDDTWYEIKGSAHNKEGTIKDYEVTYFRPETETQDVPWEDNLGNTGVVATNAFHRQPYYPEWITEDSYTISGTLLNDDNIDMSNPSFITSKPFEYGYADNTSGGDQIDIADAIDSQGNPVHLSGIDFIKIQTGIQANMGWLGELSTEVTSIADLSLVD